jgi:hypothetical protein
MGDPGESSNRNKTMEQLAARLMNQSGLPVDPVSDGSKASCGGDFPASTSCNHDANLHQALPVCESLGSSIAYHGRCFALSDPDASTGKPATDRPTFSAYKAQPCIRSPIQLERCCSTNPGTCVGSELLLHAAGGFAGSFAMQGQDNLQGDQPFAAVSLEETVLPKPVPVSAVHRKVILTVSTSSAVAGNESVEYLCCCTRAARSAFTRVEVNAETVVHESRAPAAVKQAAGDLDEDIARLLNGWY